MLKIKDVIVNTFNMVAEESKYKGKKQNQYET